MLKMLDLFSGIGGFSLAADWTGGIETAAFCEIEPYCQKVLKKHWPDVPIYPDIKELKGEQIGSVDIVCGGFPCQPFSYAGKRRGKADDRHLWPEMFRIIQECKPSWVVGENVVGLIDLALEDCFVDLETEGYEVQPLIIPACAVNAPHRRDRIWILAHSRCSLRPGNIYGESHEKTVGARNADKVERSSGASLLMSDSYHNGQPGEPGKSPEERCNSNQTNTVIPEGCVAPDPGSSRLQITEQERQYAGSTPQCDWWAVEPDVGRVANGIPNRVHRLRALGNSIVPQVAYQILQGIVDIEKGGNPCR